MKKNLGRMSVIIKDLDEVYDHYIDEKLLFVIVKTKDSNGISYFGLKSYDIPKDENLITNELEFKKLIEKCMNEEGFIHFSKKY